MSEAKLSDAAIRALEDTGWKYAWKALSVDRHSWCRKPAARQYLVGNMVARPNGCGPLTVFETPDHAQRFVREHTWRSKVTKHPIVPVLYKPNKTAKTLWCYDYYNGKHHRCRMPANRLPKGTILADAVICLK